MTAGKPWAWGRQDCCTWVADWCVMHWGFDPALHYRDRYSTQVEAEAMIAAAGGMVELVRPQVETFLRETADPQDGDIGVIEVGSKQTGGVRSGDLWAFRTAQGIGFVETPAIIAWGE